MTPEQKLKKLRLQQEQARSQQSAAPQQANGPTWLQSLFLPKQQEIKEFVVGDDDPNSQNLGERIGSTLNKAGESMTFGAAGDETSAALEGLLPGVDYEQRRDHYRQQEEVLERYNPGLAMGAEFGGAMVGAVAAPSATLARGAPFAKRAFASALAGGAGAGTYGFAEGENLEERKQQGVSSGLIGAATGSAIPFIGAGVQRVADKLTQARPIREAVHNAKTAAQQRSASGSQYQTFQNSGAEVSLPAFQRMTGQVDNAMRQIEPSPNIPGPLGKPSKAYRQITKSLSQMGDEAAVATQAAGADPARTGVSLASVEDVRKSIGPLASELNQNFRPTRGAVSAQRATDAIDEFIDTLLPEDLVAGDKDAAVSALKKARNLWRRAIKTQKVESAIDAADDYLSGSESGIRNQFKSLLRQDKKQKLFTEAERAFLKKTIGGNALTRLMRGVGDGLGRKAMMITGGAFGGLDGAAIGAASGEMASRIGDATARRRAELARALISQGGLENLPVATDRARQIAEALMRRGVAVTAQ